MSFLSGLRDCITAPIQTICNWAEEPIKRSEHRRCEESKDSDVQREINRQIGVEKALSEQRMREKKLDSELELEKINFLSEQKLSQEQFSTELTIKRETEIVRIIAEIEQFKKDKEFDRMKAVSDAMMLYQKELSQINVEAVNAIGSMRIELQHKAYDLIQEKTLQYNELQDKALLQAEEQLARIDNNPNMSESSKAILTKAVDKKLAGIIDNATQFIVQLNDDMRLISEDINLITTSGQNFIQRHLEQFQLIGFSEQTTELLSHEYIDQASKQ